MFRFLPGGLPKELFEGSFDAQGLTRGELRPIGPVYVTGVLERKLIPQDAARLRERGNAAERARKARKSLRVDAQPEPRGPAALRVRVLRAMEARPLSLRSIEARVREGLRRAGLPPAEKAEVEAAVRAVADLRAPGLFHVKDEEDLQRALTAADFQSLPRHCLVRAEDLEEGQIVPFEEEDKDWEDGRTGKGGVGGSGPPTRFAEDAPPGGLAEGGGRTEPGASGPKDCAGRGPAKRPRVDHGHNGTSVGRAAGTGLRTKAKEDGGLEGPLERLAGAYAPRLGVGGTGERGEARLRSSPKAASSPAERSAGGGRHFCASTSQLEHGAATATTAVDAIPMDPDAEMFTFLSQDEKTSTEVSKSPVAKKPRTRRRARAKETVPPVAETAWVTIEPADDAWLERLCSREPELPEPIQSDQDFEVQLSEYETKYAAYFHAHQELERGERDKRALWQARCTCTEPSQKSIWEAQLLTMHRARRVRSSALDQAYRVLHKELEALRHSLERWAAPRGRGLPADDRLRCPPLN